MSLQFNTLTTAAADLGRHGAAAPQQVEAWPVCAAIHTVTQSAEDKYMLGHVNARLLLSS